MGLLAPGPLAAKARLRMTTVGYQEAQAATDARRDIVQSSIIDSL